MIYPAHLILSIPQVPDPRAQLCASSCTFGIFANKWRIFYRSLGINLECYIKIVRTACVLHKFVRRRDGVQFEDTIYSSVFEDIPGRGTRGADVGVQIICLLFHFASRICELGIQPNFTEFCKTSATSGLVLYFSTRKLF